MRSNKNQKREKFMKRLKKKEDSQVKSESVRDIQDTKKDNNSAKLQEEASQIAERILMRELRGKVGKKDIDEESR